MPTFSKAERICSVNDIQILLSSAKYLVVPPLRIGYRLSNGLGFSRILVSVPKRNFKRAVKRNLLKRRIREAYRLQKELLSRVSADVIFVYVSKEIEPYGVIADAVAKALREISRRAGAVSADVNATD